MPPEAEFWDPCTALPSRIRDAVILFEQERARHNGRPAMPSPSRFVGMMERDPEFVYDLLPFDSEGSFHPVWESNILHLSESGAAIVGGGEGDAYPIP